MSLYKWLFDPSGLTPHGFCLTWEPGLIGLHAGADTLIGLAYLSIPLAIASFARQRRDLSYNWLAYPFVGFILACGATHLFSVLTLWVPVYGLEGLVKAVTALLSIATATLLWPLIPRLVALPSPMQLVRLNTELSRSIEEHKRTSQSLRESEARGRVANLELERRVEDRTADLQAANQQLRQALEDRASALQALARSEAEFRASFANAAVGKLLAEPKSRRILRVNDAFARMMGYEADKLVGVTIRELTYPEDYPADEVEYSRLLTGLVDAHVYEKRYLRRDGTTFWARISATLARVPESDHPILTVASIEDIDARRHAETALLVAKLHLENVLAERTAALDQRDILLREVYHRVKNNLQIVDSLLAMQARKLESAEGKSALNNLRGRIYALGLVHQQLMQSKDLKTFDVSPFLNELSRKIINGGALSGVNLDVDACQLSVGLDFAIPIGLIVTELVTNSLKHAFPDRGGTISVVLRQQASQTLCLVVSDNGTGLAGGDASLSSGSGLGTRIVNSLVKQLEGTMVVHHHGGTTTEIIVAMPAAA